MNELRFKKEHKANKFGDITYIMFHSFRINYNHGLLKAIELHNETYETLNIVLYHHKEKNERNNRYFHDGIKEFSGFLSKFSNSVSFVENITKQLEEIIQQSGTVIIDKSYLKEHLIIENGIKELCLKYDTSFITVESNVIVPIVVASDKEEYAARTIRNKIWKHVEDFNDYFPLNFPVFHYEQKAIDEFDYFVDSILPYYDQKNDPSKNYTSKMSVYLKYGFISPLYMYQKLSSSTSPNKESFLEELIIRRELAYNFVYYNKNYDSFEGITYDWAYYTMGLHETDQREYIYSLKDYIDYNTHDPYFNAAMKEMIETGYMHGYMRMYWAKKIIEWSKTYKEAYEIAIYLNNYYFLDGNTPNGYTGVAWCFGKHDRAFTEREIFGKLRYMNDKGLKRKFDIDNYIKKVGGFNA